MGDNFNVNRGLESKIKSQSIQSGSLWITEDGQNIYLDSKDGSKRIHISDVIDLSTESPTTYFSNKLYIDGKKIKIYNDITEQLEIISDIDKMNDNEIRFNELLSNSICKFKGVFTDLEDLENKAANVKIGDIYKYTGTEIITYNKRLKPNIETVELVDETTNTYEYHFSLEHADRYFKPNDIIDIAYTPLSYKTIKVFPVYVINSEYYEGSYTQVYVDQSVEIPGGQIKAIYNSSYELVSKSIEAKFGVDEFGYFIYENVFLGSGWYYVEYEDNVTHDTMIEINISNTSDGYVNMPMVTLYQVMITNVNNNDIYATNNVISNEPILGTPIYEILDKTDISYDSKKNCYDCSYEYNIVLFPTDKIIYLGLGFDKLSSTSNETIIRII